MVTSDSPKHVYSTEAFESLRLENVQFVARIEKLERQISLNSTNSSKPPSSDGLKKPKTEPRTKSLRRGSGNKPGGQKGHKGGTLCQTAEPDHAEDHFPPRCRQCGSALAPVTAKSYAVRQVFDLPAPQPLIVTEHRSHACLCEQCGKIAKAKFPMGVKAAVQYGPRVAGVVYPAHESTRKVLPCPSDWIRAGVG